MEYHYKYIRDPDGLCVFRELLLNCVNDDGFVGVAGSAGISQFQNWNMLNQHNNGMVFKL